MKEEVLNYKILLGVLKGESTTPSDPLGGSNGEINSQSVIRNNI
jgi:hypothetical protein